MKKQIVAVLFLASTFFACSSNKEHSNDLLPKNNAIEVSNFDAKKLATFEENIGVADYTNVYTEKTWKELDAFYNSLTAKAQELKVEKQYLDIVKHNLIVRMVTSCGLLESNDSKILFYAQEFEKLGALHDDVAGAFYAKVKNLLPENAISLLRAKSQNFDAQNFETVKATIEKNRTK